MKNTFLSLVLASVFIVVLLAGLTSAAVLTIANTSAITSTINHGGEITIPLNVTYTGDSADIAIVWSGTPTNVDWTFPTLTTINKDQSVITSVKFKVPLYYSSGLISANLHADGTGSADQDLAFLINVNTSKSLTVSDSTISSSANSTTITIKNEGNTALSNIALNATGDFTVSFSSGTITIANNNISSLAPGASGTVTITIDRNDDEILSGNVVVTATASDGTTKDTGTISLASNYCQYSNLGTDLSLDVELNNQKGFGDDDAWYPFDEIQADITVENNGDYKISGIVVEWGLYNAETNEWIIDDKESKFSLKDGASKDLSVSFKLDEKLDKLLDGDFKFYVRATGEFDDSDSSNDNQKTCVETSDSVDVTLEEFVILDNIELGETASCGSELHITANAWNIGEDDLSDVSVLVYNQELGINQNIIIGDIDSLDKEKLDATIKIPENAVEKSYNIQFKVYDEDNDLFQNENDDDALFTIPLAISGSCSTASNSSSRAVVSATLQSGGKAGKELVIKSTITNTGTKLATYTLNAANYADWANSAELDTNLLNLDAGATKNVLITFDVKKDVSGEKSFDMEVISGNALVLKQPVSVTIEKSGGFLAGITGNVLGGNGYLWLIGALNVILVIIIILVALRIAKS